MATKQEAFRELRLVITYLISDLATIQRVLDDAGIDSSAVNFVGGAQNVWHNALKEAIKQSRLVAVIEVIRADYKNNHSLVTAYRKYLQTQGESMGEKEPTYEDLNLLRNELSITWGLWPLQIKVDTGQRYDANYDFPTAEERLFDLSQIKIYHGLHAQSSGEATITLPQVINAEELCTNYLLNSAHQLIGGQRSAGKTWLRLYLERYALITNVAPPPVFFFAPVQLQFRATEVEIVQWLARSVAQQLFLRLFMQAHANQEEMEPVLITLGGIAPFLKEYGYDLHIGYPFLTQPTPTILQSSLDDSYWNNPIYRQMKQVIEAATPLATAYAVEPILNDLQKTLEILDYQRLLILIDNWDRVAARARNALLTQFLTPSLLTELTKRKLFLKVFVPTMPTESLPHFQPSSQWERRIGNEKYRLSLYSHS